jgi:hypothetical protein
LDHSDKDDIFKVLKEFKEDESSGKSEHKHPHEVKMEEECERELEPLPPSPLSSVISRPGRLRKKECEWDDYLDRMNHSDYSEF